MFHFSARRQPLLQAHARGPLIHVDDPDAEVLGTLDPLEAPGFCVKRFDDWTSVFVSAPMLNEHILRNIARAAGVHVYADQGDLVLHEAREGWVSFCLTLPAAPSPVSSR